ncbi:MAG: hypothetical protein IPH09_13160 [bacterium]|nr:hypothetical protein [bacterium]
MDLVKKNRAVWASDLAKRASAKGIEWTPEEQARATSIMGKRGVTLLDDVNDESMFAIRTEGVGIEKPLLDRAMDQFASAATLGTVVPSGQYEGEGTLAGGVADVAGGLAGMAAPVGALTGVLSPALRAAAGPAAFGIYGGVTAGEGLDLAERGKAAAYNTALGAGLHIAPQALVAGVGKALGPEAAAALAKAMGSIPGQAITAGGTMAGLEAASGGDPLAGGLGGILAAALTGGLVPGPTAPEARVAPRVEPSRPLAGLAAAEARVVPEVSPEAMPAEVIKAERKAPELKMVERPIEPQDAPVLLDVAKPSVTPEVKPNEIPEPPKTLLQRLEELKARNGTLAEEKRVADAARQQDIAAREEALASGALTPEQARAQRMAESAKRRTAPEDKSHVLPRERTSKGYTDNQLYEFSMSPDGMKVAMGSGLSFQDIMGARKRVLSDLAAIREIDRDVRLGSGLGGVSPADLLALRETTRAANRAIAEKMTGGDLQFDPQYAVKDNPMDKAAVKFRQTRDISDYAARLEGVGEPSRDFIAELPGLSDFNLKGEHYLSGRMYSLQKAGGGAVGNAVEKHVLWPMKALDDAKTMWSHQQKAQGF